VTGLNNYTAKLINPSPSYQYDIKIDHNFSDSNRLSARYSRYDNTATNPNPFLATLVNYYHIHQGAVSDNWTISPTMLWTNRVNFHRFVNTFGVPPTVDPLSVGFPKDLIVNP
jgi:hypothetical protein